MSAVISTPAVQDHRLVPGQVPPTVVESLDPAERAALTARIQRLLVERDATLVAHYYTSPELQELAEATGGFTYRFSNALFPALRRVADELRTYYVVGYVPTRPDDGRFRRVRVEVDVPGASARTKIGYVAGNGRP